MLTLSRSFRLACSVDELFDVIADASVAIELDERLGVLVREVQLAGVTLGIERRQARVVLDRALSPALRGVFGGGLGYLESWDRRVGSSRARLTATPLASHRADVRAQIRAEALLDLVAEPGGVTANAYLTVRSGAATLDRVQRIFLAELAHRVELTMELAARALIRRRADIVDIDAPTETMAA